MPHSASITQPCRKPLISNETKVLISESIKSFVLFISRSYFRLRWSQALWANTAFNLIARQKFSINTQPASATTRSVVRWSTHHQFVRIWMHKVGFMWDYEGFTVSFPLAAELSFVLLCGRRINMSVRMLSNEKLTFLLVWFIRQWVVVLDDVCSQQRRLCWRMLWFISWQGSLFGRIQINPAR